jgi:ABC-2 type transport system permease protein
VSAAAETAELREVRGPSAIGGGWRRFFDLLWLMAVTDFKRNYFGTVLGYLWSLVRPLLLFAVLLFVFTKIIRIGSETPNYPVLLLLNIVLFSFFQEATTTAVSSVVAQEGIVRKTQFPRLVIPLSVVLTAVFNLVLNLIVVFVFILAWGVDPTWTWLLFPVAVGLIFIFTTAIATMLSALFVRFRDIQIIWTVVSQVLFYGTPVLYPISVVPETYQHFMMINPLAPIFTQVEVWMINPDATTATEAAGGALGLLPAAAIFVGACVFGAWIFNRGAPRIAEQL